MIGHTPHCALIAQQQTAMPPALSMRVDKSANQGIGSSRVQERVPLPEDPLADRGHCVHRDRGCK